MGGGKDFTTHLGLAVDSDLVETELRLLVGDWLANVTNFQVSCASTACKTRNLPCPFTIQCNIHAFSYRPRNSELGKSYYYD